MHVAIIMDGSGRWATARGLPRSAGHEAGVRAVRRTVEAAARGGAIDVLTLFAFSGDNWHRPKSEVAGLMTLFERYLREDLAAWITRGVRVRLVGRRDRIGRSLREAAETAERRTAAARVPGGPAVRACGNDQDAGSPSSDGPEGPALQLRLAIDYSGREALLRAAQHLWRELENARGAREQHRGGVERYPAAGGRPAAVAACGPGSSADAEPMGVGLAPPTLAAFGRALGVIEGETSPAPDVDLLIRTGGEHRFSDFALWECAYAELVFTDVMWPDFGEDDLASALAEYGRRDRRFGRLPDGAAAGGATGAPGEAVAAAADRVLEERPAERHHGAV
jgi:undecaprenyl diphosphate synthase